MIVLWQSLLNSSRAWKEKWDGVQCSKKTFTLTHTHTHTRTHLSLSLALPFPHFKHSLIFTKCFCSIIVKRSFQGRLLTMTINASSIFEEHRFATTDPNLSIFQKSRHWAESKTNKSTTLWNCQRFNSGEGEFSITRFKMARLMKAKLEAVPVYRVAQPCFGVEPSLVSR